MLDSARYLHRLAIWHPLRWTILFYTFAALLAGTDVDSRASRRQHACLKTAISSDIPAEA